MTKSLLPPGVCAQYTGDYLTRSPSFYVNYLKRFSNKPKRILDLGCGPGLLLECCKMLEINAVGVEFNLEAVELNVSRGLKCYQHDLHMPLSMFEDESFDAVISLQVIEHLPSAAQIMSINESFRLLRPKGELHIDSPCLYNPDAHVSGHISLLTPTTLAEMVSNAGFSGVSLAYNYSQEIKGVPKLLTDYIWDTYRPDILSKTATVHAIK